MPLGKFLLVRAPETASPSCFLYRLKPEVRVHRWSARGVRNVQEEKKKKSKNGCAKSA